MTTVVNQKCPSHNLIEITKLAGKPSSVVENLGWIPNKGIDPQEVYFLRSTSSIISLRVFARRGSTSSLGQVSEYF